MTTEPAVGLGINMSEMTALLAMLQQMGTRLDAGFVRADAGFARIDIKLDSKADKDALAHIDVKLDTKADKADVLDLRADMAVTAERLNHLEKWRNDRYAEQQAHTEHSAQNSRTFGMVWRIAGAVWGMATTIGLILVTAGYWHP